MSFREDTNERNPPKTNLVKRDETLIYVVVFPERIAKHPLFPYVYVQVEKSTI